MLSSPLSPSKTMRIFSYAEYFRRVFRLTSRTLPLRSFTLAHGSLL